MSVKTIVIEPGSSSKQYWKDVLDYRGLLYFLAKRDLAVRYKQTAIGALWALIRPLLTIGMAAFINWLNGREAIDGTPVLVIGTVATIPWILFSSVFSESSNSLIANSNLITKVYFPRLIVPLSTLLVNLADFLLSLLILIVVMVAYGIVPGWHILLLPAFILLAVSGAIGAGFWIASLNVKYRDFRYVVPVITQFGLFVSPILFSSSDMYSGDFPVWLTWLWSLNPMVAVIDGFRFALLDPTQITLYPGHYLSTAMSPALLVFGIYYFRKKEREFADII